MGLELTKDDPLGYINVLYVLLFKYGVVSVEDFVEYPFLDEDLVFCYCFDPDSYFLEVHYYDEFLFLVDLYCYFYICDSYEYLSVFS